MMRGRKRRTYEFWRQRRNVIKKSENRGKGEENGAGWTGDEKERTRSALAKGIGTGRPRSQQMTVFKLKRDKI